VKLASQTTSLAAIAVVTVIATWQRARAVDRLMPDYDEMPYLDAGFRYAERMAPGRWGEILDVSENNEHPPLVKLAYGAALKLTSAPRPVLEHIEAYKPMPETARPAFQAARWTSAVPGIAQVAIVAAIHPLAGLLLAVEGHHAKYTSQAYLEGIPGLFYMLSLFLFERATRLAGGGRRPDSRVALAVAAFALLGAAAAGKYTYGAVGALTLAPLTILAFPRRPVLWLALVVVSMVTFVALDPYLWPDPIGRISDSVGFHFAYGQSEHVKQAGLPWYFQAVWMIKARPTISFDDPLPFDIVSLVLLPLAAIGAPLTAKRRPVWACVALIGCVFLLIWPVKWPQYLLIVLPPLCICAAHVPATVIAVVRRLRSRGAQGTRATAGARRPRAE
jgi:hypothetical protein